MSSRSDQHTDEVYHDDEAADYGDRRDEGPYTGDRGWFPYLPSWGWGGAWGVIPWASRRDEADEARYDEASYDPYRETEVDDGGAWSLWDESLITLLLLGGLVLFLFPEPATSGLGILLIGLGVVAWLVDLAT